MTQCPASVTGFRRFHSWQYPGRWTHVPSLLVKVRPMERGRGFVAVTGELVVVWTSQFGPQMVDEEGVLWGWYTVTEV